MEVSDWAWHIDGGFVLFGLWNSLSDKQDVAFQSARQNHSTVLRQQEIAGAWHGYVESFVCSQSIYGNYIASDYDVSCAATDNCKHYCAMVCPQKQISLLKTFHKMEV